MRVYEPFSVRSRRSSATALAVLLSIVATLLAPVPALATPQGAQTGIDQVTLQLAVPCGDGQQVCTTSFSSESRVRIASAPPHPHLRVDAESASRATAIRAEVTAALPSRSRPDRDELVGRKLHR